MVAVMPNLRSYTPAAQIAETEEFIAQVAAQILAAAYAGYSGALRVTSAETRRRNAEAAVDQAEALVAVLAGRPGTVAHTLGDPAEETLDRPGNWRG